MEAGESLDALSLRSVAKAAGVVPGAFYRHFASMDDLGLALIDESFRTLHEMLRGAREAGPPVGSMIRHSVEILVRHVRENRQHFLFISRSRASGNPILRHAIRAEIRLFTSDLATDLARLPRVASWSTEDLGMLASLIVSTMISTVEAILDAPGDEAQVARVAEKQLRLAMLGVPRWRSHS
jgi:AcrR family transcriptional regulator